MKKTIIFILCIAMFLSFASTALAKAVDITGSDSFMLWNRCNNRECDESFILFGYNSCTSSVKMYSVVESYAKSKGVTMYAVDGSLLGIREALGGDSIALPAVVVYNKATKTLGGGDGITSKEKLAEVADKILDERNPEIKITIGSDIMICDGKKVKLDVPATIVNGRTMIPLRAVFEAIGAEVVWNEKTNGINAKRGGIEINLTVGSDMMTVNYDYVRLDVPATIVESRTLVPVRAITESFGCTVNWDEKTSIVTIQ